MIAQTPRFVDLAPATAAVVAGSGRSGTTWLQELINYRNDHRVIFEPLYTDKVPFIRHFCEKQYLRSSDDSPQFLEPVSRILSGDFRNEWTDQFNDRQNYRRRLVKEVRANLLLHWLRTHFPQVPVILILRHPLAVVASQLTHGWAASLDMYFGQSELVADFLSPFGHVREMCQDEFDQLLLQWCIENYVPLKQFDPDGLQLFFYEELVANPGRELPRLFAFLKRSLTPSVFSQSLKPSALARGDSAIMTGEDALDAWRKHVGIERMRRAMQILRVFGLDQIYHEETMPSSKAAFELLESNRTKADTGPATS